MLPSLDFDAGLLLWALVTVAAAGFATGMCYEAVNYAEARNLWFGPPGLLVAYLPYTAWVWGATTSGALMLFEAATTGTSSVPGDMMGWALRAGLATAVWFVIAAVGGSTSDWDALFILTMAGHVAALVVGAALLYAALT